MKSSPEKVTKNTDRDVTLVAQRGGRTDARRDGARADAQRDGARADAQRGSALVATVLEIQRMSTEDGPGLRTSVFFKGCTLACTWCHNPESIRAQPQRQWIETKCIGCRTCVEACPNGALSGAPDGSIVIDRDACRDCGACTRECPTTAMELLGETWELEALLTELEKDRAYFENSKGGGITVGGGEPAVQARFVEALLRALKERGLRTALDTCGWCSVRSLDRLLPHADLVLFDLKLADPKQHARHTGRTNERILQNLLHVRDSMRENARPAELWIRTPLIPGVTATTANVAQIGRFIAENLNGEVSRWELCAFNNLCKDKYRRLGIDWPFKDQELLTRDFLDELTDAARRTGIDPQIVSWTGSARLE